MKNGELTAIQRQALKHFENARSQGVSLSAYCRARGVVVRQTYDAITHLRRLGRLPGEVGGSKPRFVAVKIAPPPTGSTAVCRIVLAAGVMIECAQWPPRAWLASLASADAAA